eukprot:360958-Chlamydomonas_euryale.AAC.8
MLAPPHKACPAKLAPLRTFTPSTTFEPAHGFDHGRLAPPPSPGPHAPIHDGLAAVQLEGVIQLRQALARAVVSAVDDPAVRREQHGRAQVLVRVPPVRRAAGGAARAQDTLVQAVQLQAALLALVVLGATGGAECAQRQCVGIRFRRVIWLW